MNTILLGGLEHELYFPYIGNFIIPTDEVHHFSEGLVDTTNQIIINHH
jgi:mannitol-specific phosphotransferase system IIBC component